MKTCQTCKQPKFLDDFGKNKNNLDGRQNYCKECSKLKDKQHYLRSPERQKAIRQRNLDARNRNLGFILDYLREHPCVDCGESDPVVLEFDHQGDKTYTIGDMAYHGLETIKEEISKCEVRCANCHRRKTAKQFGYYRLAAA